MQFITGIKQEMNIKYKYFLFIAVFFLWLSEPAFAKRDLPKGYLLTQILSTYYTNQYGAVSKEEGAEKIFSAVKGRVDGIEFQTMFFDEGSLTVHKKIALIAKKDGIDLWATSWELLKNISIKAFGQVKPEFQAYVMEPDGSIVPALIQGQPLFDALNTDAMTWFLKEYRAKYLEPFKGLLNGFFFNEDVIPYMAKWSNNKRYDYWRNAAFSPAVLKEWQAYCVKNNVEFNGKIVNKFPVHKPDMVAKGKGQTEYYPGYDVPEKIYPGQRFADLPQAKGVWKHWYDFLSGQFINNWVGRIAAAANEINKDNPNWYGALYFGLHTWSLPYEEIEDPNFTVNWRHWWGAWGRQRGLDLLKLAQHPEIDFIVCETYPPIKANLEYFIKEYKRIVDSGGKKFGVMLHRDDTWKLDMQEETQRWEVIRKYKPELIVRYPLWTMLPWGKYYDADSEIYFFKKLMEYRNGFK